MAGEADFIAALRGIARHPAARGLIDDAAVIAPPPGRDLVLTHDALVEGVHYLPSCPPRDVAWKLVAVNVSDLAAKGADPIGALMGYALTGDAGWDAEFVAGLGEACAHFALPLLGGDTVSLPPGAPRVLNLTAIGAAAPGAVPARSGAVAGDRLWVTGAIGDAGLGLRIALGELTGPASLLDAYRRPRPDVALGRLIAPHAHAMADISDGLLIDARRMADASGLAVDIDLDAVPLSREAIALAGSDRRARLAAATAGDDYVLLIAAPATIASICLPESAILVPVGRFAAGAGITLHDGGGAVPLPPRLGYEHGRLP